MAGSKERLIVFYKDIVEYNTYLSYGMYFILGITIFMFYKFYLKPKFLQFLASRKKS